MLFFAVPTHSDKYNISHRRFSGQQFIYNNIFLVNSTYRKMTMHPIQKKTTKKKTKQNNSLLGFHSLIKNSAHFSIMLKVYGCLL